MNRVRVAVVKSIKNVVVNKLQRFQPDIKVTHIKLFYPDVWQRDYFFKLVQNFD